MFKSYLIDCTLGAGWCTGGAGQQPLGRFLFSAGITTLGAEAVTAVHLLWQRLLKSGLTRSGVVQSLSRVWLLRPHRLQPARSPCPSPTPRVYANSCPSSRWHHPTISSSVVPFSSCLPSFPAFSQNQLFTSGGQSDGGGWGRAGPCLFGLMCHRESQGPHHEHRALNKSRLFRFQWVEPGQKGRAEISQHMSDLFWGHDADLT